MTQYSLLEGVKTIDQIAEQAKTAEGVRVLDTLPSAVIIETGLSLKSLREIFEGANVNKVGKVARPRIGADLLGPVKSPKREPGF